MSDAALAVSLALSCSVTWGIANVFIQRAARELGDLRALLWAQLVGCALLVPVGLLWDGPPTTVDGLALGITAVGSAFGYYGMMRAFRIAPLGAITPVVTSWPLFATAAGILWLGERPGRLQLLGGLLVVVGAAGNGALARGGAWLGSRAEAFSWGAASAVGFGIMTAGVARLRPDVGELTVIPLVWGTQWMVLAPVLAGSTNALTPPRAWASVVGMAVFEAVGFVAYSVATRYGPVSLVSPPASLSALLTAGMSALLLGERVGAVRWLLIGTAVAGTVLLTR
jgi:drug/metabolite transporter (DMT)-like permease